MRHAVSAPAAHSTCSRQQAHTETKGRHASWCCVIRVTKLHADSKHGARCAVYQVVHIYSFVRDTRLCLNAPCCRLAYSNALFFVVHEVHDLVGAVVEGLLSAVSGLPADQQRSCSR